MPDTTVDCAVLGATGYVAGELLRLLAGHPALRVRAAISRSKAGTSIESVFPHLRGVFGRLAFQGDEAVDALLQEPGPVAVFSALPHGESAARIDRLLDAAERLGKTVKVVDLSADFRIKDPAGYENVYGKPHGAPDRLAAFTCALPDLETETPDGSVAHPGCFTTATTLACAPLAALKLAEPRYFVSAITGSTGSGREPSATTHHPERHGNLRAYSPLQHRHEIEMRTLLGRAGGEALDVIFVPHSGPFARGIHATVHARLREAASANELADRFTAFYAHTPFVDVSTSPPNLKEVVGTNRCRLGIAARGKDIVVFSVIDNLTKGAAGGGLQWMNRLLGFEQTAGLILPGLGWN